MTRRLVLSYLAVTVVVLLVLEVPLAVSFARGELGDLTARVERDAVVLGSFALSPLETRRVGDLPAVVADYAADTGGRVVVVDRTGRSVADSGDAPGRSFASRPEFRKALDGRVSAGTRHSNTLDHQLLVVAVPVARAGEIFGAVRVTYPTSAVDARIRRYVLTLTAVALVCLLVAGLVAATLARSVTRPIRRLRDVAGKLGGGDLSARADSEQGPGEVQMLARTFNDTAQRLEELVAAQDAFVGDVSHGLRTPLTALRLRLENLEAVVRRSERPDVEASLREVLRLSRLVDQLLALARADRSTPDDVVGPVDVTELLAGRQDVWSALVADRGMRLVAQVDGPSTALGHRDRLTEILDNLLANAVDASPAGGTIRLAAAGNGDRVVVEVSDDGPGIPPEEREAVFDRFRTSGRTPGSLGGSGLGLAISRRLARRDGGDLVLEQSESGGVRAVLSLRKA